jgi:hypothetical protein
MNDGQIIEEMRDNWYVFHVNANGELKAQYWQRQEDAIHDANERSENLTRQGVRYPLVSVINTQDLQAKLFGGNNADNISNTPIH